MTDIRYAADEDLPALRQLWDLCFPEDQRYAPFFFAELYRPEQALVLQTDEGAVAAMLHMLPYTLSMPHGDKKAWYMYAVGTHPAHRGKGFATELCEQALFEMYLRGVTYALTIPAQPSLFDFYAGFDFGTAFLHQPLRAEGSAFSALPKAELSDIPELARRYEAHLRGRVFVRRTERDWQVLMGEFALLGGGFFLLPCGGYIARDGQGTVLEGFGQGLVPDGPAAPLGMARVIRMGDTGWDGGFSDEWCPWNEREAEPVLTPAALLSRVFPPDAYMNLMHN